MKVNTNNRLSSRKHKTQVKVAPFCRGPAPADPGYSKRGRRRRPIYLFIKDLKSNRMRIAQ